MRRLHSGFSPYIRCMTQKPQEKGCLLTLKFILNNHLTLAAGNRTG
jgi:hypothetical protein